jgi:hypothetical protein
MSPPSAQVHHTGGKHLPDPIPLKVQFLSAISNSGRDYRLTDVHGKIVQQLIA